MAWHIPYKRISKLLLVLAFVATIGIFGYLAVGQAFYPNRVKITVLNGSNNNPVRGKSIIFRETECSPKPCEPAVLAEGKTDLFGNIRVTTKELNESFEVVVEGFAEDGPWLKRPGSLNFTRNSGEEGFYTRNIAQSDLTITLQPSQ